MSSCIEKYDQIEGGYDFVSNVFPLYNVRKLFHNLQ